jgi:hypothetical protein
MSWISDYIRNLLTQMRQIAAVRPSRHKIDDHQKQLDMYRSLLAEYLRQHRQWERAEVPGFLSVGITTIRGHILDLKGRLRGWAIEVDDHPDDQGPDEDIGDEVQHQRALLKIHRRNLATYTRQQQHLPAGQPPVPLVNAIEGTRSEIQRIKAALRGFGAAVEDLPEEEVGAGDTQ